MPVDTKDFFNRIRRVWERSRAPAAPPVSRIPQPVYPPAQMVEPQKDTIDLSNVSAILEDAGRKNLVVTIMYKGFTKDIHPYAWRKPGDRRPGGRGVWNRVYLYAWCCRHNKMHTFKPEMIRILEVKQEKFIPLFNGVEFGKI